ncbi:MAG: hypothetical protein JSS59_09345 [Proteobacteria bacterium]|uniref:hypothetical protein n=1 Tax=Rudaea sp. TaxID=2136325 RepID=UPI0037839A0A|nr:hypothetical protein [Pseudomonadota bacterium]
MRSIRPGNRVSVRVPPRPWLLAAALATSPLQLAAYDWPQFNGNPQHGGNNTDESVLGAANVASLALQYQATLPAVGDGTPVFLDGVTTASGVRDLLFLITKAGDILALDVHAGTTVWSQHYPNTLPAASCSSSECITASSPALDPNRQFVYVYGLDGNLHKLLVGSGTEVATGGWPQIATLKPGTEKQSGALAIATVGATSYLYSAMSAHNGDAGDVQGHLTTVNLGSGAQNVFNFVCSDKAVHFALSPAAPACSQRLAGGWARPGVIYDGSINRAFVGTGNGSYNLSLHNWGDSILALGADGTASGGTPIDAYTPTNQSTLDQQDADLGSTAPAILPTPAGSKFQHLAVQGGKDQKLRLINLANMSGAGGAGHLGGEIGAIVNVPQGGQVKTQPAVWVNPADRSSWAFIVNSSGAAGMQLAVDGSGNPSLAAKWQNGAAGASPLVANNVLYLAGSQLRALDPTTGTQLWGSGKVSNIHFQSPVVACASVYVLDNTSHLSAFGLSLPHSIVAGGNDQTAVVGGAYANPLQVLVSDANNNPLSGTTVTFQLPASGAGGTFAGDVTTATVVSNASGIATSPTLTANHVAGNYLASATIANGACPANFHLASTASSFIAVAPARVLETRPAQTTSDGMFNGIGSLAAGGQLDVAIANRGGLPGQNVAAVVLNVTAANASSPGYVTAWPTGAPRPFASNLNLAPGHPVANLVISRLGDNGFVSLFNSNGSTDLIADVQGWFPTGSGLAFVPAARLLDTRPGATTIDGQFAGQGPVGPGGRINLQVLGRAQVPASAVSAVVLNVTAVGPTAAGYATVWPADVPQPTASNLNFVAGDTVANLVVAKVGGNGQVALYNSAGNTNLVADVSGWFQTGSELTPLTPFRLLDTRGGGQTGDGSFAGTGQLGPGAQIDLQVTGRDAIPANASAVVLNVTAVGPSTAGYLGVRPTGSALSTTSNVNFTAGATVPNLVVAAIGSNGRVSIFNSSGTSDVVVDVIGWFAVSH